MPSKENDMKKRITIATVLVAVVALTAVPLVMAGPHGGRGHGAGHGFAMLGALHHAKEELDLTDQQTEQIKAIFVEAREQNAQYRERLHGGYKSVAETLLANPNDVAAAQALIDQQTAAERALKTNILNSASKALAVLNAEQRAKLGTMLEKHAEKHAERHGRRGR
jgi:Spy/CpxP family protein refolding chaperone